MKPLWAGFSFIEMIITVAIIGALSAIALPSYYQYLRETRRTDAYIALTLAAAEQERAYAINNAFISDISALGGSLSKEGFYTLSVAVSGASYMLTATAIPNKAQGTDSDCLILTLNHQGIKAPTACWR
ncbi:type IV pilin protein [Candidatus Sororendozoicomonas aggregata]|uniref:type IV pilin protein n=1 Tax=Candidatus Sororendozoicomonas aggregata TaxID=3073239 RepID=UPI002ED2A054